MERRRHSRGPAGRPGQCSAGGRDGPSVYDISAAWRAELPGALEERGLVNVRHGSVTNVNPRAAGIVGRRRLTAALASPGRRPALLGEYPSE